MSQGFQFKQFFIQHDQCAMKVNTDGILLGAIAHIDSCRQVLDLGTGSGLVAIMLAQRSSENCAIIGLELEQNAYLQAVENAKNSAWHNRICILQGDVMQHQFGAEFDLIVSNPPYFSDSLTSGIKERDLARSITTYTHLDWLIKAKHWLSEKGRITMILPTEVAKKLILQSEKVGLYCIEQWQIFTKQGKIAKRMIVSFSLQYTNSERRELIIYNENNNYTVEFKHLTKDFYLNF